MNNKIPFLLSFLFLSLSLVAQPNFYTGTINGKIKIKMKLTKERSYAGEYFYVTKGELIKLKSKPEEQPKKHTDSVTIYEYLDLDETPNGFFRGIFSKNGSFSGLWFSNEGKKFPFLLNLENSVNIKYNSTKGLIYPQVYGLKDVQLQKKINQKLIEFKNGKAEGSEPEDNGIVYGTKYNFEIIYNGNNVLTLSKEQEYYTYEPSSNEEEPISNYYQMGASSKYYCINLISGDYLKFSEVLVEKSKEEVNQKIVKGIMDYECERILNDVSVEDIMNSICLTQQGIMFPTPTCPSQGKYESEFEVVIPYGEMKGKGYINPNGLLK